MCSLLGIYRVPIVEARGFVARLLLISEMEQAFDSRSGKKELTTCKHESKS